MSAGPPRAALRRRLPSRLARGLVAVTLAAVSLAPGAALAEQQQEEKKQEKQKQATIKDPRVGKTLLQAQELLQAEQWEQAQQLLDGLNLEKLDPYPKAIVHQMKGHVYASQEKYEEATQELQSCLDQQALPESAQLQTLFLLAQINMILERFDQAVLLFESWFAQSPNPAPSAYYTLASAYYQAEMEDKALEPAEQAVFLSAEPRESWLGLLAALYVSRERYKDAVPLVEQLVTRFSKKSYWIQLAALYYYLDRQEESFAAQELAYLQGLLTEDRELRRLAQLSLYNDIPFPAAEVLQQGLEAKQIESNRDAWQLLGNSWLAAREYERAIQPLERAATLADDGELWLRLGQVHLMRREWTEVVEAVHKALDKGLNQGGPNTAGHAYVLIGIAQYEQEQLDPARSSFARALDWEKTREMAERWLKHVEREAERKRALEGGTGGAASS